MLTNGQKNAKKAGTVAKGTTSGTAPVKPGSGSGTIMDLIKNGRLNVGDPFDKPASTSTDDAARTPSGSSGTDTGLGHVATPGGTKDLVSAAEGKSNGTSDGKPTESVLATNARTSGGPDDTFLTARALVSRSRRPGTSPNEQVIPLKRTSIPHTKIRRLCNLKSVAGS